MADFQSVSCGGDWSFGGNCQGRRSQGDGTGRKGLCPNGVCRFGAGNFSGFLALAVSDVLPGWMGAEPAVQEEASRYFFIISLPMLFRSAMILFSAVLRASGDTRTPMVVNLLINGLNILLNFFLIYQTRPITLLGRSFSIWGAGMGVTGAAIATATAITAGGILMTLALFKSKRGVSPLGHGYRLDKAILTDVWRVGLPNAGERTVVCLGHMVFAALVAGLGTTSLAAHSIAITAETGFLYSWLRVSGRCYYSGGPDH